MAKFQVEQWNYSRLLKDIADGAEYKGTYRSRFFNTLEEAELFSLTRSHRWAEKGEDCAYRSLIKCEGETVAEYTNDIRNGWEW